MPKSAFYGPAFLAVAFSAVVSACGGDSTAPNRPAEVVVAAADTLRSIGASAALTAVVRNASHQEIPGAAVSGWESSNQAVVTVNATTGLATAVANGAATITAHAGAVSGATRVIVLQAPASVNIVPPTDTLRSLGATSQYAAVVKDAGGSVISAPGVSWASTNTAVVTFDANGLATAVSNGSVYVQARVSGVVDSVSLAVHQRIDPTKSTISVVRSLLFVDDTVRATLQTRDALNHPLTFGGAAIVFSSQGGSSVGTFRPVVDNQDGSYSDDFIGVSLGTALTITASIDGAPVATTLPTMRIVGFTRIAAAGGTLSGAATTTGGFTCGIITTGDMYCWGIPWFGVRGTGSFVGPTPDPTPTLVGGGHQWTDVAGGLWYVCAVANAGGGYCWGSGGAGELGNGISGHGSLDNVSIPAPISGGSTIGTVSIGQSGGACATTLTKTAMCWGAGVWGRLGNGSETSTDVPVVVSGGFSFDALSTSYSGTCGISAGSAYCWGIYSVLGLGASLAPDICTPSVACSQTPFAVSGGLVFRPMVALDGNVACAVGTDDKAYCWGSGFVGDGSMGASAPTPVSGGLSFTSLGTAGDNGHCGISVGGAAYCWGKNSNGRLGNGTTSDATVPTAVSGGHRFIQMSSSQDHTCGVATDGNAWCWGGNDMGELGNRTTTPSMTPVRVRLFAP
jgi:regulator of chromosome condensation (RCC1) repeat-containing protein/invasin-like protein/Big-like domain-containing protein